MNLRAYDKVTKKLNKNKSWIDRTYRCLFSKEIDPKRKYTLFLQRYEPDYNSYRYFIALLDDKEEDECVTTEVDGYGRFKFRFNDLWNTIGLNNLEQDVNIIIKKTQSADDGDVYELFFDYE